MLVTPQTKLDPPKKKHDLTIPKNLGKKLFCNLDPQAYRVSSSHSSFGSHHRSPHHPACRRIHRLHSKKKVNFGRKTNVKKKRLQSSSQVNMLHVNKDYRYVYLYQLADLLESISMNIISLFLESQNNGWKAHLLSKTLHLQNATCKISNRILEMPYD